MLVLQYSINQDGNTHVQRFQIEQPVLNQENGSWVCSLQFPDEIGTTVPIAGVSPTDAIMNAMLSIDAYVDSQRKKRGWVGAWI